MIYIIERKKMMKTMSALNDALADDGFILVEFINLSMLSRRSTVMKESFIRTAYTEKSMQRLFPIAGFDEKYIVSESREKRPKFIFKSLCRTVRVGWNFLFRVIYVLERGKYGRLPLIYTKLIISVAVNRLVLSALTGCHK